LLYDKNGTPIGVLMTNVMEDIPDGTSLGFEVSNIMNRTLLDNLTLDMIGSYIVYANIVQMAILNNIN